MTIHTLVHKVDRFSCQCNSIQSIVSIVHLRAISSFLFYCCMCIQTTAFPVHIQFIHVQQCDYIYQNKFFKCTYVHLCLFHSKPVQHIQHSTLGLLTHNATGMTSTFLFHILWHSIWRSVYLLIFSVVFFWML